MKRRSFLASAAAAAGVARAAELEAPRLNAIRDNLAKRKTATFLVVHRGKTVMQWYGPGFDAKKKHFTASLARALVGGTSLLVAMSDGRIRPTRRAAKYIPAWARDPKKSQITIRQLATHTSGIEDSSVEGYAHGKEPAWKGAFWRREPDPFTVSVNELHSRTSTRSCATVCSGTSVCPMRTGPSVTARPTRSTV